MNIETFQFTVYTMLIGMFIVFVAMIVFSLIMVLLKSTARGRGGAESASSSRAESGQTGSARLDAAAGAQGGGKPLPAWALVAVAAYLTAEGEERQGPSAEAWRPDVNQYDPWLVGGKFARRVGV